MSASLQGCRRLGLFNSQLHTREQGLCRVLQYGWMYQDPPAIVIAEASILAFRCARGRLLRFETRANTCDFLPSRGVYTTQARPCSRHGRPDARLVLPAVVSRPLPWR